MTNRALHLPSGILRGVGLNTSRGWSARIPMIVDGKSIRASIGPCGKAASRNVTISLQDVFGGYFRVLLEEGGITQNSLQVLRNLTEYRVNIKISRVGEEYGVLTSHIVSLYVISALTASMARKLSSTVPFLVFGYRMLGDMTVARLCMSILLPDSSSMCEKDDVQLRKVKRTSIVSRCALGRRQQAKCSTRFCFSGSDSSVDSR